MTSTFTLEIDFLSAKCGSMDCWLITGDQRLHLEASGAFPPFGGLLGLIRAILANSLPYEFFWQAESRGADFRALPVDNEDNRFRLQIIQDNETFVDNDFVRIDVANSLLESLQNFVLDCPEAATDWDFPYFLIEDFEQARATDFRPNTDAMQKANFVFEHFDDSGKWPLLPIVTSGAKKVHPSFHIWVGNNHVLHMQMADDPQRWKLWFDLLAKINHAELPVEVIFDFRKPLEECENELDYLTFYSHAYGFRAKPDIQPEQFLLDIWQISEDGLEEQRFSNVRLDRWQFVETFLRSFDAFLHTDYLAYLEGNPDGFDLRSLLT